MHEAKTEAARNIKMSCEAELNMERCAEFMACMIKKYGAKILDEIEAEEKSMEGNDKYGKSKD